MEKKRIVITFDEKNGELIVEDEKRKINLFQGKASGVSIDFCKEKMVVSGKKGKGQIHELAEDGYNNIISSFHYQDGLLVADK